MQESEVSDAKFVHFKEVEKMVKNSDPTLVPVDGEGYDQLFIILEKRFGNKL